MTGYAESECKVTRSRAFASPYFCSTSPSFSSGASVSLEIFAPSIEITLPFGLCVIATVSERRWSRPSQTWRIRARLARDPEVASDTIISVAAAFAPGSSVPFRCRARSWDSLPKVGKKFSSGDLRR